MVVGELQVDDVVSWLRGLVADGQDSVLAVSALDLSLAGSCEKTDAIRMVDESGVYSLVQ